jgi:hypothetical protein
MAALGEGGIRMEARIEQIQFLKVTRYSPEKAEVQTRERWNCYYYNIESGEQVSENIITYENKYILINEAGRWLVDDISIIDSNETNKNSGLRFIERPPDKAIK